MSLWQSGDSTDKSHLIQTWWDLENSRINPTGYTFENMQATVDGLKEQQKIALLSFNYNFGYIDTMAYYDGRMQVVNNELLDAGGASPYIAKNITFSGLAIEEATAGTNYTLESSLAYTLSNNTQHSITGYSIANVTTGTQYTMANNSNLSISFSTPGLNYLHITTQTTAGSFVSVQVINVKQNNQSMFRASVMQSTAAPVHELLTSDISFQGYDESMATTSYADYHIYYHYANANDTNTSERVLRKPIIMLDGIDFEDGRNYQEIYEKMLSYQGGHLGQELRKKGYDLIILNFPVAGTRSDEKDKTDIDIPLVNGVRRDGGNDYIERNAFLLVKLIQTVNERLRQNGSNEKLVIVGPSMGGQISRYALAYMEKKEAEGVANMKHNTKLWISFDSPHEGANIPLAGQRSMIYLGFITGNQEARKNYFAKLGNPASKQMLIEQFDVFGYENSSGSYYDYTTTTRLNGSSPFHQTYYNNLRTNGLSGSNGWPTKLKKIALVNGAGSGSKVWGENQEFLNVIGRVTFLNIRVLGMACNFMPNYGQYNKIFSGWRSFNFDDDFYVTNINPHGSMDNVPGGLFNTAKELQEGYNDGFEKVKPVKVKPLWNNLLNYNSFIPTISALGFKNPSFDWSQPVNNRNLVQTGEIYFDGYYAPPTNEQHITLTSENVAWLNTWLENVKNDTLNICDINYINLTKVEGNNNIGEASFFRLTNLPENATVSWRIDNNPGFSQYPAGDNGVVIIKNGIIGSATLTAQINYICGMYEVSLPIYSTFSIPDFNIRCIAYCPVNNQSYVPHKNYLFMSTTQDGSFSGELADYQWNLYHFDNNPSYPNFVSNIGTYKNTYFQNIQANVSFPYPGNFIIEVIVSIPNTTTTATFSKQIYVSPQQQYLVSPNPSSSYFNIGPSEESTLKRGAQTEESSFDRVTITDIAGNIKLSKNTGKTNNYRVDVNRLSNGIYYLNLYSNGKLIEKKTIQVSK